MAPRATYSINEIFYSLQGEGVRAGTANVFVRFAACNLACNVREHGFDCDTDFAHGDPFTLDALVTAVRALGGPCRWIMLTGGEPALQVDAALVERFHAEGYSLAIETNGTIALPEGLDWVCVSPKTLEASLRVRVAAEVKYVRGHGQALPETQVSATHQLISPAFEGDRLDPRTLDWCIALCRENPPWRLSVQQHKAWRVR